MLAKGCFFEEEKLATSPENLASKTWESPRRHEETEATADKNSFSLILGIVSIAV